MFLCYDYFMENQWAYFNCGNNHYQSLGWQCCVPEDIRPLDEKSLAVFLRTHLPGDWSVNYPKDGSAPIVGENAFKGRHFIAFDGERWRVGYGGGPNSFLDAEKYPAHIYSCEFIPAKELGIVNLGLLARVRINAPLTGCMVTPAKIDNFRSIFLFLIRQRSQHCTKNT